jgi:hypothetical protein
MPPAVACRYNEATLPVVHSFEKDGRVRYVKADQPQELVYLNVQRIFRDLEAKLRPSVNWTVAFRLTGEDAIEPCVRECNRFVSEVKKIVPRGSFAVGSRLLHRIVPEDQSKGVATAGGGSNCIIS